jgi:SAM-dependent methyltransferase
MPMPAIATRHLWTAEMLAAAPADRVLEIGCGHGIATGLVCEALTTGHLTAIDRSAKMVAACSNRNAAAIAAGRLAVLEGVFEATAFPEPFDRSFSVNVDFPLHPDKSWARKLAEVLRPGGLVLLVIEAPVAAAAERFACDASAALAQQSFTTEITRGTGMLAVRGRRS